MHSKPFVLGICAANSGSGKTYVIEKLIPKLKKKGYSVSAIKHAHHNFDIDTSSYFEPNELLPVPSQFHL